MSDSNNGTTQYVTMKQAMDMIGCSRQEVGKYRKTGKFPGARMGETEYGVARWELPIDEVGLIAELREANRRDGRRTYQFRIDPDVLHAAVTDDPINGDAIAEVINAVADAVDVTAQRQVYQARRKEEKVNGKK